jgi:dephospho-CoA kinase
MLKVGLTGGIAAGKSTVGDMFVALGAHLVHADRLAHELMNAGEPVYNQVVRHFGREILNPDGSINRPKLAELAFGSPDLPEDQRGSRVAELNRIVHPAVIRSQEDWMQAIGAQDRNAVAMVEAALILEAGMGKRFDRLIVVTCAPDQRAARFAARQKMDLETAHKEVQRRMAAQLSDEEKVKAADYVIDNSGSLAKTREQVAEIWKKLNSEASSTVC